MDRRVCQSTTASYDRGRIRWRHLQAYSHKEWWLQELYQQRFQGGKPEHSWKATVLYNDFHLNLLLQRNKLDC